MKTIKTTWSATSPTLKLFVVLLLLIFFAKQFKN